MSNRIKQKIETIELPPELHARSILGIERAAAELAQTRTRREQTGRSKAITKIVAASIALIIAISTVIWNTEVMAAIHKALQFVPGIGVVKEDGGNDERYVLKQPISKQIDGGTIHITSFVMDEEMTHIVMNGMNVPHIDSVVLLFEGGEEYRIERSMGTYTTNEWTFSYWHKGKLAVRGSMEMQLQINEQLISIPVPIEKADSFTSYEELGPTMSSNEISITAVATQQERKTRVFLVSRHPDDFRISSYGVTERFGTQLHVQDEWGEDYSIEAISGITAPIEDFYILTDHLAEARSLTLTIPQLIAVYEDKTSVKLAAENKSNMNMKVELADYPITITGTELIGDSGLRVYVDVHYNEQAGRSLVYFKLHRMGHMAKMNEETGAIEYIEFDIKPGAKSVKVKFHQPEVVMRGPWQFELQVH